MNSSHWNERVAVLLLVVVTLFVTLDQWGLLRLPPLVLAITALAILLMAVRVRFSRKAFVIAALVLTGLLIAYVPDGKDVLQAGLRTAAFIAAFFMALSTLRNVSETSPAIAAGGTYLAVQPPGRRYAALTLGGHLFALLLNYGAISLLGGLATASARAEPNAEIRHHRTRRMLLAIQRGFVSSLSWSPLAFSMAITNALIPGARWADVVGPGLVTAAIIAGTGWALDTAFKPRLSAPAPPRGPVEGSWTVLVPLLALLVGMGLIVGGLHELSGVSVVGIVMLTVPFLSLGWAALQHAGGAMRFSFRDRMRNYLWQDLPGYRGELTLLTMAGYIGTVGAPLLLPVVPAMGLDVTGLPAWLVVVSFVWLIPILGQFGMNPILAVTLIAPLIPAASQLGVTPAALVVSITAGWALSGAFSPFTATTLLIGSFGGVSALHVGWRWNGIFVLCSGMVLSLWVLIFAFLLG
ncbi:hypothetical protein [Aliiruegeria sabulilitoris]|uniref:hypothetical protein n=1 Tax=Aliiruegeria sabulilitoris TaxID=1510458 RepID=UPI000835C350|nr:hypothetical protein [Aliiruegeria sabulilitoris]NDR56274.1 hypothetical protein [Pseudoruegeria sp. M32A2M]